MSLAMNGVVERLDDARRICLAWSPFSFSALGDVEADIGRIADGRIDLEGLDLLRRLVRHLFDVHAAFGGGDEGDAAGAAVDQRGEIKLAVDGRAVLDIEALHDAAMRAGLVRDQRHAEHALGFFLDILDGFDDLDAAAFAAAAGMDLRLHHPDRPAKLLRRSDRFLHREGGLAARHGHAEAAQNLLGLIFVDVHGKFLGFDGGMRGTIAQPWAKRIAQGELSARSGFCNARRAGFEHANWPRRQPHHGDTASAMASAAAPRPPRTSIR